jgi:formate dehydrogenase maturation protein FdhE
MSASDMIQHWLHQLSLPMFVLVMLCAAWLCWVSLPGFLRVAVPIAIRLIPWLSADYRSRRISTRQMCPACGDRGPHGIKFEPEHQPSGLVALTCRKCSARWGYNPIVKPQAFVRPNTEE